MLDPKTVKHQIFPALMEPLELQIMGKPPLLKKLNTKFNYSIFSNSSNEDVRGKPWYFGPISRSDCDVLMAEKGQDGDFLVRDSESNVSRKDFGQSNSELFLKS